MKRGADLAVRELAVSEVTIAIVEHTYCAFRNGDVNSKAQCQLAYVLLDWSEPIVVQCGWCRLSWCFGSGVVEEVREGKGELAPPRVLAA
jgi:hypothetical protein